MRRIQIALAMILAGESVALILEAVRLAQRMTASSDGTFVPNPFLYPSPFSAGLALVLAVVLAAFATLFAPITKTLLYASIANFVLGSVGIWALHRGIVWVQGVSHGFPGWR